MISPKSTHGAAVDGIEAARHVLAVSERRCAADPGRVAVAEPWKRPLLKAADTPPEGMDAWIDANCDRDVIEVWTRARGEGEGDRFGPTPGVIEDVDDPHRLARLYLADHRHLGMTTLAYHRGRIHEWNADACRYAAVPDDEMEARIGGAIKREFDQKNLDDQRRHEESGSRKAPPKARKVTASAVGNTLRAVRGLTLIPGACTAPCWRDGRDDRPDPLYILPTRNALVDLSSPGEAGFRTIEPTPAFFSPFNVGYRYDPDARAPSRWLRFLDEVFPGDPESIRELRKWFFYLLTPDTSRQKMLYLIGLQRSGKGTIAHVISRLVGQHNVAAHALMDLAGPHDLQDCIDKSIILVSDARVAGSDADLARMQERVLKISGEDEVRINPKYREPYSTKLHARFVILSNEIPGFRDASGAFRSRARPLKFGVSFEGREDHTLRDALTTPDALAGILNWALAGKGMLDADGGFLVPRTAEDTLDRLSEAANPILEFVADWADVESHAAEERNDLLYAAYRQYCAETGRKPANNATLGRHLRSTYPHIAAGERRLVPEVGRRVLHTKGIRLTRRPDDRYRREAGAVAEDVTPGY